MHALIAGGGIGGLAAALLLHRQGYRVTVCEAVREVRPLGVGINVLPHGVAILEELGLKEAAARSGVAIRAIEYRTRFGHVLSSEARGTKAGFPQPQISIHRGALQFILLNALKDRAGANAFLSGHRALGFEDRDGKVTGRFDTSHGPHRIEADVLIGADGFHSVIRRSLHPDEGPAHAEGMVMYRGAAERTSFGDGRTMFIAGNHDLKFVCYPISTGAGEPRKALINWVAEVRTDMPRAASEADWTRQADRQFIDLFRDFRMPDIDPVELMTDTPNITVYPMIDRDPLPSWGHGTITLLGDAAHPMYPIGANGASQALIDAGTLARCLGNAPWPEAGLRAYEAERVAATRQVVLANRLSGPERVLDIADARLTGPGDRVEDLITPAESAEVAAHYRRVAGFAKRDEASA